MCFHDDPKLVDAARKQTPGQLRARIAILDGAIKDARSDSAAYWRMQQQIAALQRVLHVKETV